MHAQDYTEDNEGIYDSPFILAHAVNTGMEEILVIEEGNGCSNLLWNGGFRAYGSVDVKVALFWELETRRMDIFLESE
jgi:hypothetical protein